jgi:hypothetical protein
VAARAHSCGKRCRPRSDWLAVYLGINSGRAGSGRAKEKPDSVFCGPGPARPDYRAANFCPSPARRAKKPSGRRAIGPSLQQIVIFSYPSPARYSCWAKISCPGPARQHALARRAGPFSGRVGPGRSGRASHAQL